MVRLRTTSPNSSRNSKTFSKTTTSLCDFTSEITIQESAINVYQESAKNTAKTIRKCVASRADPAVTRPNSRMQKISHQQIQITKNLFLVVCTFFICFVPLAFVVLIGKPTPIVNDIAWCLQLLGFANSAINFFIYASKHPDFKIVLGHMMRCTYSKIPQPSKLLKFLLSKKN